jgi:hypothetical protein
MSLLFSFGLRSTKNRGRGILDLACLMLNTFTTFNCSSYVLYIRGVVKTPKYSAIASVRFWLVGMEFGVFLCKCFDYCSVCIRRLGLYFNLVLLEHFEFKSICRYRYEEVVDRLYVVNTRYKYRRWFGCGWWSPDLSLVRFWFN